MITFRNDKISDSLEDDGDIAAEIKALLEQHDITAGWHTKGFDIPFLQTRLVQAGHEPLERHWHVDGMYFFRGWRGLDLRSSKLKVVAEFLDNAGYDIERKPDVDVKVWIEAAMAGSEEAMDKLVNRCEADVRVTDRVIDAAKDLGLVKNIKRYP